MRSCSHLLCVYVFPCLCSSATTVYSWQQLTINNIIFKNKCASFMRRAQLKSAAGLRYCMLLYYITSVIMVVLWGTNIFCGGTQHKKFENHWVRPLESLLLRFFICPYTGCTGESVGLLGLWEALRSWEALRLPCVLQSWCQMVRFQAGCPQTHG